MGEESAVCMRVRCKEWGRSPHRGDQVDTIISEGQSMPGCHRAPTDTRHIRSSAETSVTLMNDCHWVKEVTRDQTIIIIVSVAHTRPRPGWRLSAPVTSVHAESEPGQRAGQPRWSAACMQVRTHYPSLHYITLHEMSGMDGAGGPGKSSPPVPVRRLGGGGGPARTWGRGPMLPRCRSHGLRGFSLRVSRSALSISCQHVTNMSHVGLQSGSQSTSPGVCSSWPSLPSFSSSPARHVRGTISKLKRL